MFFLGQVVVMMPQCYAANESNDRKDKADILHYHNPVYLCSELAYQILRQRIGNYPYQTVFPFIEDGIKLPDDEQQLMVPLDDKRSIQRIVFDPDDLIITTRLFDTFRS